VVPAFSPLDPLGLEVGMVLPGVQMVGDAVAVRADDDLVRLGPDDVPAMRELVARTRPGPFRARTHTVGRYLGIRLGGALIAMAGQRMNPPGWTEISAVCTHPDHRGKGLAGRLVQAVAAAVLDAGEVPFLHVAGSNTTAIRLYEALGFTRRRETVFVALRTPR
jgi:ribosomal protein S18 acetylase RimI-like enzyme